MAYCGILFLHIAFRCCVLLINRVFLYFEGGGGCGRCSICKGKVRRSENLLTLKGKVRRSENLLTLKGKVRRSENLLTLKGKVRRSENLLTLKGKVRRSENLLQ